MPGFTFVASMSAIVYAGATPMLAEVDDTFTLDPVDVEAASRAAPKPSSPSTCGARAISTRSATSPRSWHPAHRRRGAGVRWELPRARLGSIGVGGAYSFNLYKTITCGDGGMLVTDTQDLYERCFALHDQGHLPFDRHRDRSSGHTSA